MLAKEIAQNIVNKATEIAAQNAKMRNSSVDMKEVLYITSELTEEYVKSYNAIKKVEEKENAR